MMVNILSGAYLLSDILFGKMSKSFSHFLSGCFLPLSFVLCIVEILVLCRIHGLQLFFLSVQFVFLLSSCGFKHMAKAFNFGGV